MGAMTSPINSVSIAYSTVCSGPDHRKHQSSASLAFVRGIHRRPVNSPHKWPVTRKMFPLDDVIMLCCLPEQAWEQMTVIYRGCNDAMKNKKGFSRYDTGFLPWYTQYYFVSTIERYGRHTGLVRPYKIQSQIKQGWDFPVQNLFFPSKMG